MKLLLAVLTLLGFSAAGMGQKLNVDVPVRNFALPTFTQEGHRSLFLRGSEAVVGPREVRLKDMHLTLFSGDASNGVETIILSPSATVDLTLNIAHGEQSVRLIRDDVEITGDAWSYHHGQKKVSIARNARVVFQAELPDILK